MNIHFSHPLNEPIFELLLKRIQNPATSKEEAQNILAGTMTIEPLPSSPAAREQADAGDSYAMSIAGNLVMARPGEAKRVIDALAAKGVDLDARLPHNVAGSDLTILQMAVSFGTAENVTTLLEHGANPFKQGTGQAAQDNAFSPLYFDNTCEVAEKKAILRAFLVKQGAESGREMHPDAKAVLAEPVRPGLDGSRATFGSLMTRLLAPGLSKVEAQDIFKASYVGDVASQSSASEDLANARISFATAIACAQPSIAGPAIDALARAGADLDVPLEPYPGFSPERSTLLQIAVNGGRAETVGQLLEQGASPLKSGSLAPVGQPSENAFSPLVHREAKKFVPELAEKQALLRSWVQKHGVGAGAEAPPHPDVAALLSEPAARKKQGLSSWFGNVLRIPAGRPPATKIAHRGP